ncbi:MAG: YchJ family metal-binding protein [Hydrogenophaga sp.]|uniref:YchJ family protein n=1 Tax=Hydrogenophaga sp. TaxID=1904254 RepID=UPI00260FFDC7|nr:YchJ family metal-binding protein [Hydrogenophaga sp.]MDD3784037.1 YchJ family metal-binding protein [Hydrogenophaga sp.]
MTMNPCPCGRVDARGRPVSLERCCGPFLDAGEPAPDAERLMRSRYSAFVLGRTDHLLATWHPDTRPDRLTLEPGTKWLGLTVKNFQVQDADHATVAFVARSRVGGRGNRLHETSRFVREGGRWYYVDGVFA